jgi:HSP20 family protein
MPLRPDPLQQLLELQERMNRVFDETLGRDRLHEPTAPHGSWVPTADVVEHAEAYLVELDLPGLERDDVVVQAHEDEVLVRGERRPAAGARPEAFHRLERHHGPFTRSFRFPAAIDPAGVVAELHEGVLRLTLPKRLAPPRKVEVRRAG